MRISQAVLVAAICGTATSFSIAPSGVRRPLMMSDAVAEAPVEEAEAVEEEAPTPAAPKPAPSGLTITQVRNDVSNLSADNFSATLTKLEPFLLNEAGVTFYTKSMKRIARQAKELGKEVPEGYALEAACTSKRRAKQNAFIQQKEAERVEAEAAAADAPEEEPAAEEEATEEEEAPVEA